MSESNTPPSIKRTLTRRTKVILAAALALVLVAVGTGALVYANGQSEHAATIAAAAEADAAAQKEADDAAAAAKKAADEKAFSDAEEAGQATIDGLIGFSAQFVPYIAADPLNAVETARLALVDALKGTDYKGHHRGERRGDLGFLRGRARRSDPSRSDP